MAIATSQNGFNFVKAREGENNTPSNDVGHAVWGHGHDQQPGEIPPAFISDADSDLLLWHDIKTRVDPALNHLAAIGLIPANASQNQIDACADFCYNDGPAATATMLHHGWNQVTTQMSSWVYAHVNGVLTKLPGLVARRALEVSLFNS